MESNSTGNRTAQVVLLIRHFMPFIPSSVLITDFFISWCHADVILIIKFVGCHSTRWALRRYYYAGGLLTAKQSKDCFEVICLLHNVFDLNVFLGEIAFLSCHSTVQSWCKEKTHLCFHTDFIIIYIYALVYPKKKKKGKGNCYRNPEMWESIYQVFI